MFTTAMIPLLITKATLKRELDDEESYRVADVAFSIEPFGRDLAAELGEYIHRHLFTDDGEVRPEVYDISLALRVPRQRIMVASAPDAPLLATLKDVKVGDITLTRKTRDDRSWYRATIDARIDLREREIREFLFHHFGEPRYFTFMDEQLSIRFEAMGSGADTGRGSSAGSAEATH